MLSKLKALEFLNQIYLKNISSKTKIIRNFHNPPTKYVPPRFSDVRFEYVKEKDFHEAASLINQVIYNDEAMTKTFKLQPTSINKTTLRKVWYRGMERNQSVVARSKWDDKIKGVAVNLDLYHDIDYADIMNLAEKNNTSQTERLHDLLVARAEIIKESKPFECGTPVFHIDMVVVDPEWCNLKIGKTLVRESVQLAKLNGFEFVTTDVTSPAIERIVRQLGFKMYWRKQLKEFRAYVRDKAAAEGYVNVYMKYLDYHTEGVPPTTTLKKCLKKSSSSLNVRAPSNFTLRN